MAVSIMRPNGHLEFKPMPLTVVQAATAEAHRKEKLVFAHPTNIGWYELILLDGDPARDQSAFYHVALTLRPSPYYLPEEELMAIIRY
jgi:hypothetical protein